MTSQAKEHAIRIEIVNLPDPVVLGQPFKVTIVVECSEACELEGALVRVYDHNAGSSHQRQLGKISTQEMGRASAGGYAYSAWLHRTLYVDSHIQARFAGSTRGNLARVPVWSCETGRPRADGPGRGQ